MHATFWAMPQGGPGARPRSRLHQLPCTHLLAPRQQRIPMELGSDAFLARAGSARQLTKPIDILVLRPQFTPWPPVPAGAAPKHYPAPKRAPRTLSGSPSLKYAQNTGERSAPPVSSRKPKQAPFQLAYCPAGLGN